jgi:hypothetical protein
MKKIKIILSILSFSALVTFLGCSDIDDIRKPLGTDAEKPGVVSDIKVKNFPGGATITYALPKDPDLEYVVANYSINKKTAATSEVKASHYSNQLTIEGFSDAGDYDVTLYSVDRSSNKSEPVVVKVAPESPPLRTVFKSLQLGVDFGGLNVAFANPAEAKLAIVVITKDNNGDYIPVETLYTQVKGGSFAARGFDTLSRSFGVYVRDRWDNYSDTIFKEVKPLFEKQLDKTRFQEYRLPTDEESGYGWNMPYLWDEKTTEPGFHTIPLSDREMPIHFTFDLGVVAKLSRFKLWEREGDWLYKHGNPRKWVMWGSEKAPNPDGSFTGWTKLMDCESIKPSGSPYGVNTGDDIAYMTAGEEFVFPLTAPRVRYIRMQIYQNWSDTKFVHFTEIAFWGDTK